jgi:hypothetical protein
MAVVHRRQRVQAQVGSQKARGQRVVVTGRHIGPAAVAHQAGQRQAATDFQDALPRLQAVKCHACRQLPG